MSWAAVIEALEINGKASAYEPAWVLQQRKTFSRWCNQWLEARGVQPIDPRHLETDLADGRKLAHVLEAVAGAQHLVSHLNSNPSNRLQQIHNCDRVLSVLREEGVPLVNIGAEDICDGNPKLLLGLLWLLILRYHIAQAGNQSGKGGEAEKGGEAKKNLLLWCQSVLNPQGLHPKDFNQSWTNGLCFSGLVNALKPDAALPLHDPDAARENLEAAFRKAKELLDIPPLLEPDDLLNSDPDDKSIMTYVSYFRRWHTEHGAELGAEPVKPAAAVLVVEEKPQTPVIVPEPEPEPAPEPTVASGKQHGLNDAHILAQVEKRFCKLRALQNEKLALEAKIRVLEEKLRTAWTDERRREHERELLERLATAEKELELVSARFRVIEDSMLRKEKESKRLLEDKKELESKFNDYRRSAGEKLSKIRSDYDMLERRHQKQLFDEQNKVIDIKVKWEMAEKHTRDEKRKRIAAERRTRQLERKLAQVLMNVTHSNLWAFGDSDGAQKLFSMSEGDDDDDIPEEDEIEEEEDDDEAKAGKANKPSGEHDNWEKLLGIHAYTGEEGHNKLATPPATPTKGQK